MLVIRPFRGIIYNREKIPDMKKVVAPPYDVISPEQQDFYYGLHPYNIIRIILGKDKPRDNPEDNRYTRAAHYLRRWLSEGILKKEKIPAIYVYEQDYQLPEEGERVKRKGFIALMKLEQLHAGVIFPHERIFEAPQVDRLNLMLTSRANLSAIFSLFEDSSLQVDKILDESEGLFQFEDRTGIKHSLSALREDEKINQIIEIMKDKKIFIADGHHRYLTALKLREKLRQEKFFPSGADYVMMYFLNTESKTVTILPVHRLLRGLSRDQMETLFDGMGKFFHRKPFLFSNGENPGEILKEINKSKVMVFGLYHHSRGYFLLTPKDTSCFSRKVNSEVLDELVKKILGWEKLKKGENIDFTPSVREAVEKVKKGEFQLAFFLAPVSVDEVKRTALRSEIMPPKSTYFYPKLLSGLVMRDIDDAI